MNRLQLWFFKQLCRVPGLKAGLANALLEDCAHKLMDARDIYCEFVPERTRDLDWLRDLEQLIHRLVYVLGADQPTSR